MSVTHIEIIPNDHRANRIVQSLAELEWEDVKVDDVQYAPSGRGVVRPMLRTVAGEAHARAWVFSPTINNFSDAEIGSTFDCSASLVKGGSK